MGENMIFIYSHSKKGTQYLMDKNDNSIYIYYPSYDFNQSKIITIITISFIMLYILLGVLNTESIRSLFYITSIANDVRIIVIGVTIFVQLLLALLYKRNLTKIYTGDKKKIEIGFKEKKKILKKSAMYIFTLNSIFLSIGLVFLIPISIAFIENGNAIMYFWFLILSSIFVSIQLLS